MESKHGATCTDPFHFCNWWQFDRLCGKKDNERFVNRCRLALGDHLHNPGNCYLANDGITNQYPFWPIQVFL